MTPIEKYQVGLAEHGMPRQLATEDQEKFRIDFLPAEKRTIQKDGVHFAGLTYYSDKLVNFTREDRRGKSPEQVIRFDPFDIRRIWILDSDEKSYYRIASTTLYQEPINLTEWKMSRTNLAQRGMGDPSARVVLDQYKRSQAIVENAFLSTKKARRETEIVRRNREIANRFSMSRTDETKLIQATDDEEYQPPERDQHDKIRTSFSRKG
jgi:putative transposase